MGEPSGPADERTPLRDQVFEIEFDRMAVQEEQRMHEQVVTTLGENLSGDRLGREPVPARIRPQRIGGVLIHGRRIPAAGYEEAWGVARHGISDTAHHRENALAL